ncbi:hypothetical protein JL721_2960 [Aureococcus anophagefferens]|nr:hypothetical protein JL721_2960 [Aureococcus anophagefferens]
MPIQHAILALCSLSATALIAPRAATPALTRVRVETLNFGEMLQNVAKQVGGARASAAASQTAGEKLKALLGKPMVDPAEIAAACADDVLYEDMASSTFKGPAPEPLLKPGEATEALLKAVTANVEKEDKPATYEPRSPTGAVAVADYLWNEAYPKGATPAVALELFAEDIRYEDFNYPTPFLGKPAVKEFVEAFDIPGIDFDGPKGISFYESDGAGKISYIRDIPATTPAPLQAIAALVNPELRVFSPRAD